MGVLRNTHRDTVSHSVGLAVLSSLSVPLDLDSLSAPLDLNNPHTRKKEKRRIDAEFIQTSQKIWLPKTLSNKRISTLSSSTLVSYPNSQILDDHHSFCFSINLVVSIHMNKWNHVEGLSIRTES